MWKHYIVFIYSLLYYLENFIILNIIKYINFISDNIIIVIPININIINYILKI